MIHILFDKFLNKGKITLIFLLLFLIFSSCSYDYEYNNVAATKINTEYKTKHVIVVIVDGLRYSEGWGDSTHQFVPRLANELSKQGVVNTRFYNQGPTYTAAGHTSITTGIYQEINNGGNELPDNPSVFQYWNKLFRINKLKSWIITSKDKLAILANCKNPYWNNQFMPSVNSGVEGLGVGSGYREDSLTLKIAIKILSENHPNLVLINFRDPDYSGHTGVWDSYIDGIRKTDEYTYRLWNFLQNDSIYMNTTTMFITSDHGRHLDSITGGFAGHGDDCDGCRHLGFYAFGPDFKQDAVINVPYEQIDLPVTIAELLGFKFPGTQGKVMDELFEGK